MLSLFGIVGRLQNFMSNGLSIGLAAVVNSDAVTPKLHKKVTDLLGSFVR